MVLRPKKTGLQEFKAYLRYRGISQRKMAEVLGIGHNTFNLKLNGANGSQFTITELQKMAEYLELTPEQVYGYFFAKELA